MRLWPLAILVLAGAFVPVGTAQQPVDDCEQQCHPHDSDVNEIFPVHEGEVGVILYAHLEDILQIMPINTVLPDPRFEVDLDDAFLMPVLDTNTNVCPQPGMCADFHFKNNEFMMMFCPGEVIVNKDKWYDNCHKRWPGSAIPIVGPMVLYWYVSAEGPTDESQDAPNYAPNVFVEAEARKFRITNDGTWRDGEPIAHGVSSEATLVSLPGAQQVYEFRVELQADPRTINDEHHAVLPADPMYFLIEVNQVEAPSDTTFAQSGLRHHTGPQFPPRIVIPTIEALRSVQFEQRTINGTPMLLAQIGTPFGSHDLDVESLRLQVVGPAGYVAIPDGAVEEIILRRSLDHDGVHKPTQVAWRLDPVLLPDLGPGHSFQLTSSNRQRTFELVQRTGYVASFPGEASLPSLAPALVLLLVVGVAAWMRSTGLRR